MTLGGSWIVRCEIFNIVFAMALVKCHTVVIFFVANIAGIMGQILDWGGYILYLPFLGRS